jgi:NAT, N-acetyltransferase, of N-acetylglutamate synthase
MNNHPEGTSDAILRFLDSIGRRSEAQFYLDLFRAESKERFANLVVDTTVLGAALEAVVMDLRFLHGLGLMPVVSVGLFSDGAAAQEHAARLESRLERAEVPAVLYRVDSPTLAKDVAATARAGKIPLAIFASGGAEDVPARFDVLGSLSTGLETSKVIFVTRRGGLRPRQAESPLPIVNLATDYDKLIQQKALTPKQQALLTYARHLLVDCVSHRMFVSVTSPLQLLRELFTIKGAGTLIKRGSPLFKKEGFAEVDCTRLAALLVSSFGRPLSPLFFERGIARIYLEEHYRGAALIRATPLGAYLCKFAVEREAQGEGIGRDLWQLVLGDYPSLFWRSRPDNPIAPFYIQECDGMERTPEWNVFWKGIARKRIPEAIALALAQPNDFVDGA